MNWKQKQIARIEYEAMLMDLSPERIRIIAPWLFVEGTTAANTEIVVEVPEVKVESKVAETEESTASEDFYDEMLGW